MTDQGKARLKLLTSGIPTLDAILGGGFPEYSSNLIAGDPGSGKTTLCHQIVFANASPEAPALYFTIIGEPPLKMLRYQQQFRFFDAAKVDGSIHFVNLGNDVLDSLETTLSTIIEEVERRNPAIVVVDSFRSLAQTRGLAGPLRAVLVGSDIQHSHGLLDVEPVSQRVGLNLFRHHPLPRVAPSANLSTIRGSRAPRKSGSRPPALTSGRCVADPQACMTGRSR